MGILKKNKAQKRGKNGVFKAIFRIFVYKKEPFYGCFSSKKGLKRGKNDKKRVWKPYFQESVRFRTLC